MSNDYQANYKSSANENRVPQNPLSENFVNAPPKGSELNSHPELQETLIPVCPDPDCGYQELTDFLINKITKHVVKCMKEICSKRHSKLDIKYWERITRTILGQPGPEEALVISAPAGSGKSTWILAFHLALKHLFHSEPALANALVGTAVVLQKVDDLNTLAAELNDSCTEDTPFMVALQGWNQSGKKRGFCPNPSVESYENCRRADCPYALKCPILAFKEKAPLAPVVGLTQERFYMMQQTDLSPILYRIGDDSLPHPRRFILFDEKYRMTPVTVLDTPLINEASTEMNKLVRTGIATDAKACNLQQRLSFSVLRPFQEARSSLKIATDLKAKDIPVGFFQLPEEARNDVDAYLWFQEVASKKFMSKPLSAAFTVMDALYSGESCLFSKTNGFSIYHIGPPLLHFGSCQTIIFDATAEVDGDYCYLKDVRFLSDIPARKQCDVIYHIHAHSDLNVSKSAMKKNWKLPAFAEYLADIIKDSKGEVFLCTYMEHAVALAELLESNMKKADYSRLRLMPDKDVPTLPYLNGTNGSNAYNNCENVIMLGYPRLDPQTYLAYTCAAYGQDTVKAELDNIPAEDRLDPNFNIFNLASVHDYVCRHLTARLEQEIYRCALRNPGYDGQIHIHLFCPPSDVLNSLLERIPGQIIRNDDLPECVDRWKGLARRYENGQTSFTRLAQFLDQWDGSDITSNQLRTLLDISPAVWKDLMQDRRVKTLLMDRNVLRCGRGLAATWSIPHDKCA